jgi:hypothetical protein
MSRLWDASTLASGAQRIQPGDIIGTTPANPAGRIIRRFQGSCSPTYSGSTRIYWPEIVHVAISLGGPSIVEAVPIGGVRISSLGPNASHFAVFRPKWRDENADLAKLCVQARRNVGLSYASLPRFTKAFLSILLRNYDSNQIKFIEDILICSTFVVNMFAGALGTDSPFDGETPASGLPLFLPADVLAVPSLIEINP